jgi:ankyrin repeat protein
LRSVLADVKSTEVDTRDSDGARSDYTALQLAAQNGHASCIELLLARGARIDQKVTQLICSIQSFAD